MKEPLRYKDFSCVHTKNIFSLLDLSEEDSMYSFLSSHVKKCTECSKKLEKYVENNLAIKVFVPKPFMSQDLRQTFNSELSDVFKIAGLNQIENKKKLIKQRLLSFDSAGTAMVQGLTSKNMLMIYLFVSIVFFSLKFLI